MNRGKLLLGAVIGLSISAVILAFGAIYLFSISNSQAAENIVLNEKLLETTSDLLNATSDIDDLTSDNSRLSQEVDNLNTKLDTVVAELASCNEEKDRLVSNHEGEIVELEKTVRELNSRYSSSLKINAELKKKVDKYECSKQIDMDYSSILESSSRLQSYVDSLPKVKYTTGSFRNTLWNNTDTKIHGIRYRSEDGDDYSMQFIVFVDDIWEDKATFNIDYQCWLDPP